MSDLKEYTNLVLHELKRIDAKLEKHDNKIDQCNETLVRNTLTLEEHVKGSIATNKRLEIMENKVEGLNKQVNHIDGHVTKIQTIFTYFIPTTSKIKWTVSVIGLIASSYGLYVLLST